MMFPKVLCINRLDFPKEYRDMAFEDIPDRYISILPSDPKLLTEVDVFLIRDKYKINVVVHSNNDMGNVMMDFFEGISLKQLEKPPIDSPPYPQGFHFTTLKKSDFDGDTLTAVAKIETPLTNIDVYFQWQTIVDAMVMNQNGVDYHRLELAFDSVCNLRAAKLVRGSHWLKDLNSMIVYPMADSNSLVFETLSFVYATDRSYVKRFGQLLCPDDVGYSPIKPER